MNGSVPSATPHTSNLSVRREDASRKGAPVGRPKALPLCNLGYSTTSTITESRTERQLAERLDLIERVERLGFYAYHLAEHHGTPLSKVGAIGAFLGAISQRTTTLRFGPLVYLLPLHHPLNLIEEIALLDQWSNAASSSGIGRGGRAPIEHALFGMGPRRSGRAVSTKCGDILLLGLRPETTLLNYTGRFFSFDNVPLVTQTGADAASGHLVRHPQRPRAPSGPRSTISTCSRSDRRRARRRSATATAREWARLGKPLEKLPMLGLSRRVVVADTDEEALRIARPAYREAHAALEWL